MAIQALVSEIPDSIKRLEKKEKELRKQLDLYRDRIVLFGKGNLGKQIEKILQKEGYYIRAFLDSYQATDVNSGIIHVDDALKYLPQDSLVLITMYALAREEAPIRKRLEKLGFVNVLGAQELRAWPELFEFGVFGWRPEKFDIDAITYIHSSLHDYLSRKTFEELLRCAICDKPPKFTLCPPEDQYLSSDVYVLDAEQERIVDCGAFDGDTMRAFWNKIQAKAGGGDFNPTLQLNLIPTTSGDL